MLGDKTNRPGPSLKQLESVVDVGMVDPKGTGLDLSTLFEKFQLLSGLNYIIQVNDCEDYGDWTESDSATFDITESNQTTGHRVGAYNIVITSTQACNGTQYVQTKYIDESNLISKATSVKAQQDWRDTKYLGFWKHAGSSAEFGTDGELQVAIVNDGVLQTAQDVDGSSTTSTHYCQIDMDAAGWSRDKVEALRFYANVGSSEVVHIDDIIRYQLQFNGGPMYGGAFPITSGTTLNENHWARWTIDGLIASTSGANVADVGPAWLGSSSLTGNAKRAKWALLPGRFIFLVQVLSTDISAGEGIIWGTGDLAAIVATGVEERSFAKALEAGTVAKNHIFAMFDTGGRYV